MDTVKNLAPLLSPAYMLYKKATEKPPGPSKAAQAIQQDQIERAATDRAEAERLAALAGRATSRRKSLAFQDERRSPTLG